MKSKHTSENGGGFKPFIPASHFIKELTPFSILCGVALAIVFGGANAYLGLRVGMTISASIPAAVISMAILRGVLKRDSILENNVVQTIGSAGESLAGGMIFTIPALFLWFSEWGRGTPSYVMITSIALAGGILGVVFMIPLRRALIVEEHGVLPYPEGTACAEVLIAGEQGGDKARTTFLGLGVGAVFKFIADGLKLFPSRVDFGLPKFKGTGFGADVLPALLGVGYIVGARISSYMLAGAFLGWFVCMPLLSYFGSFSDAIIFPGEVPISEQDRWDLWGNYIRYIGAGAVAFGGIYSLIASAPMIVSTVKASLGQLRGRKKADAPGQTLRTDRDLPIQFVLLSALVVIFLVGLTPLVPVGLFGALLIAVFGFFFATVASRIVGLVGSSNSPASGMTLATLILAAVLFKLTGNDGMPGMVATIAVGSVICVITAISGDTSQDLKTGFLLGATPSKQQLGELIGVGASALAVGGILILLNNAWSFGSAEIPAPQATLMKLVVEGVMEGSLPWPLIFTGIGIAVVLAVFRLPILPIAIGLYLPLHLSVPIMVGGVLRYLTDKDGAYAPEGELGERVKHKTESGILFSSGLIAGEGLVGILLAVLAVCGIDPGALDGVLPGQQIIGVAFFAALTLILAKVTHVGKK